MSNFKTFVDISLLKLALKDQVELKYYKEIPSFLEKTYESIMGYLKLPKENFIPEIEIKLGGRTDAIFFGHKESDDLVGRILINLGPDDLFRLSKVETKKSRSYDEIFLEQMGGQYLGGDYSKHDLILMGNPRRELLVYEKKFNLKRQPYIATKKVFRIRPSGHVSIVMVISLWVNYERKVETETVEGPRRVVLDDLVADQSSPYKETVISRI